ncbi:MAG: inverse autotransporter beta domain-containing protein, partial [Succinivibrio dextrinosolvens]|nr:inverse autotransporter beta domain-containing protein [Succinivibrio dextrinosolvens]
MNKIFFKKTFLTAVICGSLSILSSVQATEQNLIVSAKNVAIATNSDFESELDFFLKNKKNAGSNSSLIKEADEVLNLSTESKKYVEAVAVSKSIKCTEELPCIPMYNKYMMALDEEDPTLNNTKTFESRRQSLVSHTSDNLNRASKGLFPKSNSSVSEIQDNPKSSVFALPATAGEFSPRFLTETEASDVRIAMNNLESGRYMSEGEYLIEKLKSQGVLIKPVVPQKLDKANSSDDILGSLKDKSNEELFKTREELYQLLGVTGQFARGYSEAQDKEAYIKSIGLSRVNGIVDSNVKKLLEAYDGVNAEISLRLKMKGDGFEVDPQGKLLLPLYSVPKSMTFVQTGLNEGTKSRPIAHFALGERFYPQATSMTDLGHHMLGLNFVVDRDLERKHLRGSVGLEYMYDNLKLVTNIYRRLSGWRDSPDFEDGYVEERAASGWDLLFEYWFHSKFALKGGLTHWIGKDISPFGDSDPDKLEDSPYIYQLGAKYKPVPALSFEANYQRTGSNQNKQFFFGMNFNVPLGSYEFADAFNPDVLNKAAGNMILTSRSMFIERDYTMPLQYRSKPGKYYIYLVKSLGNNRYLFKVEDGFHRAAVGVPVTVTASHPSIELSNGGHYVTDGNGNFIVEVLHSGVHEATLTVTVGDITKDFDIIIDKMDWRLKAEPQTIERYETSKVTLYLESEHGISPSLIGTEVKWRLSEEVGELTNADLVVKDNGEATIIYHPDVTKDKAYDIKVIATVFGVDFPVTIHMHIYGNGEGDLAAEQNVIDGGSNTKITYQNLKPGSVVEFTAVGVGQLVTEEPSGPMDMTGTTTEGQTVQVTVDENGVATVWLVGSTTVGDTGNVVISTKTPDPYFDSVAPKITVKSKVYDVAWSLPAIVQYLEPFTATLTQLKDDTYVTFSIENETASISSMLTTSRLNSVIRLASSPNNANATKRVKVTNTQASTKYLVTGDYTVDEVSGIHGLYYHDAKNTEVDTSASVLAIQQYTPYFTIDPENQELLNWFSGDDSFKVKLTSGQPYRAITITNSESNVTIDAPEQFDANGEAEITITGQDVRTAQSFSILGNSMGKIQILADAVSGGVLTYHVYEPVINTSQGVSGENITDTSLVSGAPAFKGQANTMDYKTDYEIEFSGLLKNTPVTFSCDNTSLSRTSATTDSEGKVKVTVMGVSDYAIKNVTVTVGYQVNSVTSSATTKEFTLSLYQYTLSISSNTDTIVADGTAVVTVTGGRANEAVEWSLTGSGQYTAQDASFDSTGTAKATVQGISPFTISINVILYSLIRNNCNYKIETKNTFVLNIPQQSRYGES